MEVKISVSKLCQICKWNSQPWSFTKWTYATKVACKLKNSPFGFFYIYSSKPWFEAALSVTQTMVGQNCASVNILTIITALPTHYVPTDMFVITVN